RRRGRGRRCQRLPGDVHRRSDRGVGSNAVARRQAFLIWIGASALLMAVGAFGPWVKAFAISVSGTDGSNDGWVVLGAAVVGAGLAAVTRANRGAGAWALLAGRVGGGTTRYARKPSPVKIAA